MNDDQAREMNRQLESIAGNLTKIWLAMLGIFACLVYGLLQ